MRQSSKQPSSSASVVLTSRIEDWRSMRLLPLTGREELGLSPADPRAPRALLGRMVRATETGAPVDPAGLTVSAADRLLAALHQLLYGDRAECRVQCRTCDEPYEFTVVLSELMQAQDAERPIPDADGAYALPDGSRLRAPCLGDLDLAASPQALVDSLTVSGGAVDPDLAGALLEKVAPVLVLDLDASCPGCGAEAAVRFDMGRYLVARLAAERQFLLREAHLIASRYGWSHDEIMGLPRDERRMYAGFIEAERTVSSTARAGR